MILLALLKAQSHKIEIILRYDGKANKHRQKFVVVAVLGCCSRKLIWKGLYVSTNPAGFS
jgi:hypothetical protein